MYREREGGTLLLLLLLLEALMCTTTSIDHGRTSTSSSECTVDLEAGGVTVHVSKSDCRICHLSMDGDAGDENPSGLGCSCKGDLAAAHLHCAQAWFNIKGNNTCEICGSTALNITCANESELTEQCIEPSEAVTATSSAPMQSSEARNFWKGHRFLNFLLACMVFAFVISWLFRFNVPS